MLACIAALHYGPMDVVFGVVLLPLVVLSLPIAWWWMLPQLDYSPTTYDIVEFAVVIGANSFAWGYGVQWLTSRRCGAREDLPQSDEVGPLERA